jgi:hypothetical protein
MKTPLLLAAAAILAAFAGAQAAPPTPAAAAPAAAADSLQGEVLEAKDVGSYTYLRLRTAQGDVWAAVSRAPVKPGSKVNVFGAAEMRNFHSPTLDRTFDVIYFGVLGVEAREAAAHPPAGAANQPATEPVAKATGADAKTVAEIVGGRQALSGKKVSVRARVDRVSPNIMGKNWVHLRDGSGTPAAANYDVIATSTELPKVGAIVVARGTVRSDVEVGGGHAFKVVVENASFQ